MLPRIKPEAVEDHDFISFPFPQSCDGCSTVIMMGEPAVRQFDPTRPHPYDTVGVGCLECARSEGLFEDITLRIYLSETAGRR